MIDELIHYCIEEIGLDGEAGTQIERLADYIRNFHAEHSSRSQLPDQLVDASYQAFVFRQLVSHPDVGVGLFVPGVPVKSGAKSGIYRKFSGLDSPAPAKSESQADAPPEYDWVDLLPDQSLAEQQGLFQLQQTHGDRLRLVLRNAVIKRLLVGAADVFLPPSTYRALQLICRSREIPVLSTEIGSALHLDQKTVFYICKRLTDLGLAIKIRARETGTVASYFVATRFEDRCEILIQQKNADNAADLRQSGVAAPPARPTASTSKTLVGGEDPGVESDQDAEAEDADQDASAPTVTVKEEEPQDVLLPSTQQQDGSNTQNAAQARSPVFEYLDADMTLLWINSRPELLRFRIYLVCDATSSKVTARLGLLRRINIASARPQRRSFHNFLEHAVVHGCLQVVNIFVASTGKTYKGLRMTSRGHDEMQELLRGDFSDAATLKVQAKANRLNLRLSQDLARIDSSLPRELTLERYVYDQVARAGPSGRTTAQLMAQLHGNGHFARTIDQLQLRAEDADGEPSMSDMQIRSFHEHKQRIRSTKLYSHHAWVLQCANEGYLDPNDLDLLASAGGPSGFHRMSTAWAAPEQVSEGLASLSKDLFTPTPRKGGARIGRPPKKRPLDADSDAPAPKRGRPRKHPADPDAPPPKRGRPRKHPIEPSPAEAITPRKRGRPRKHPIEPTEASRADAVAPDAASASSSPLSSPAPSDVQSPDTPVRTSTSRTKRKKAPDTTRDDDKETAPPDSPAVGAATRRSRRLVQDHTPARPTSLLATSPILPRHDEVQTEKSPTLEAPIASPPADPIPTEQETAVQDSVQAGRSTESTADAHKASTDLSRVDDLLAASTEIKAEANTALPTTPHAGKLKKSTSTPTASERKMRTNLTQLRSSNALVQCIREAGGAMDTLLIPDQLSTFVETHGFASDAQLMNLRDRKVREAALTRAVNNGLLRRTYIRLDRPSAAFPRRQIVYLADLPPEQLQAYCEAVKDGRDGWIDGKFAKTALTTVTDSVAVDVDDASRFAKPWQMQDPFRLSDLPNGHAQLAALRQPFRDVITVYRQHFGFLSGEMLRLKAFHHACAKFVNMRQSSSDADIGTATAGLPLSFFWTEAPLDLYFAFVPIIPMPESMEALVLDPNVRSLPIYALPDNLKASLGLSSGIPNDAFVALYSLATQLSNLSVCKFNAEAQDTENDDLASQATSIQPLDRIPFYDWGSEELEKPLTEVMDVGLDADKINLFWAKMQTYCFKMRSGDEKNRVDAQRSAASALDTNSLNDVDIFKTVPDELEIALYANRAWRPYHQLRPSQVKFLWRIDVRDIPSATQHDIDRLAYVTLAPQQVVRAVLQAKMERSNEPSNPGAPAVRRKKPRFTWPLKLTTISLPTKAYKALLASTPGQRKATPAERERQGRMTTLTKARQLRQRREEQFQMMLDQAFGSAPGADALRPKIEAALATVRRKFVAGDVRFDAEAVRRAISRAIRTASGIKSMPAVRASAEGRRKRRGKGAATEGLQGAEQLDEDHDGDRDEDAAGEESGRSKRDRRTRRNFDQVNFWTPAKKELLRDAAVILRVRDQVRGRSDWSALLQVVDEEERVKTRGVIMAQWRNQYYRMRSLYGEESYLAALESRWIPVYLAAREDGTLHDPDFPASTGFDLVAQIELLRAKIDKNAVQRSLVKPVARHHLPLELGASSDFTDSWKDEFVEEPVERRFEAFYPSTELGVTTKRFETLLGTAFGAEAAASGGGKGDADVADLMAEWAVRIVIASGSPHAETQDAAAVSIADGSSSSFDAKQAAPTPVDETTKADFCRAVGDTQIEKAMQPLLDAKLIRSITFDPMNRRKPGTNFVFTEELQKLFPDSSAASRLAGVDLQAILMHRRSTFQEVCDASDGLLVEPVQADGEAAATILLMQLELMDAEIDQRPFETLRQNPAFNARVLNDEDLEAFISIKGKSGAMDALGAAVLPLPAIPHDGALEWVSTAADGDEAERLQEKWLERFEAMLSIVTAKDVSAAERLRSFARRLVDAGSFGLPLNDMNELTMVDVQFFASGPVPLAFFSPLTSDAILIASPYVRTYALELPSGSHRQRPQLTLPHIWITLSFPSTETWRHLLETVVALVFQRPGLNIAWLASRFSSTVDTADASNKVVTGTSFADVWSATLCLVELGIVEFRTGDEISTAEDNQRGVVSSWTLHPGSSRKIWAGFK
ncbi:hypothetical protein NDA16_002502 [Ustilago loliicola]|nr:hypothetical protein NDA16_002502 [Ustilago loliicola]